MPCEAPLSVLDCNRQEIESLRNQRHHKERLVGLASDSGVKARLQDLMAQSWRIKATLDTLQASLKDSSATQTSRKEAMVAATTMLTTARAQYIAQRMPQRPCDHVGNNAPLHKQPLSAQYRYNNTNGGAQVPSCSPPAMTASPVIPFPRHHSAGHQVRILCASCKRSQTIKLHRVDAIFKACRTAQPCCTSSCSCHFQVVESDCAASKAHACALSPMQPP